jgi:hypothetical protein
VWENCTTAARPWPVGNVGAYDIRPSVEEQKVGATSERSSCDCASTISRRSAVHLPIAREECTGGPTIVYAGDWRCLSGNYGIVRASCCAKPITAHWFPNDFGTCPTLLLRTPTREGNCAPRTAQRRRPKASGIRVRGRRSAPPVRTMRSVARMTRPIHDRMPVLLDETNCYCQDSSIGSVVCSIRCSRRARDRPGDSAQRRSRSSPWIGPPCRNSPRPLRPPAPVR